MLNYIKAEKLKCKRTFGKKNTYIAPITVLLLAFLSPLFYQACAFNWWYLLILPGFIALSCYFVHQKEEKKLNYRAVFSLPIDLKKVWIAKNLMISINLFISCMVLSIGIILVGIFITGTKNIPFIKAFVASFIIALTSLWQVPLCLFLSKKLGAFGVILVNVGAGLISSISMVSKSLWWLCPYTWTTRLMCPILGILPNGLFAKPGDPLLNPNVIPIGIVISILLFLLLMLITTNWFKHQEVA
ncbi:lantibiotic immunity ABC transporter MutE/EpiE family permease subunit [Clostridium sp. L74]|uniref:lantibiotic immunity ABC transporter MutE/EpiE family permease subunit n=1 Tax=Clostridium sp. L74 TaxID=1560217 RepID=UPI0006AB8EF0|nr:lantibiotic immunity ABC transporter MutE/EpiE family permease subunit [Clostridium sp. L74]KOR26774.1 multidrug ABC transporter permease [Clostridium sp. L74]